MNDTKIHSIPIIVPTFYKLEPLMHVVVKLVDYTWPLHGPIYIISDNINKNNITEAVKTFRFPSNLQWIYILQKGIIAFKKQYPSCSYIYLILDDVLPIVPLDRERIEAVEQSFIDNNWDYLYFPHYENDYKFNISVNNEQFAETEENYKYYTQIGAGLIKVDYLLKLCEMAIAQGAYSPWQFEFLKPETKHYISELRWPTVRDGFFKSGFVNKEAIKLLNFPEGRQLQKILKKQASKELPLLLLKYIVQKIRNLEYKIKSFSY